LQPKGWDYSLLNVVVEDARAGGVGKLDVAAGGAVVGFGSVGRGQIAPM
jgi:hypothetical protein